MISDVLFHLTPSKNLPGIIREGIIRSKKRGITCGRRKFKHVFLTDDPMYVIDTMMGRNYADKLDMQVLEVSHDGSARESVYSVYTSGLLVVGAEPHVAEHEFLIDHVPPESIKHIGSWRKFMK